jgi:glycosyltransferase involved in cell wall biosynthesis
LSLSTEYRVAQLAVKKDESAAPYPEESVDVVLRRAAEREERLLGQIADLQGQKERLEALLDDILGSHSWKITSPLRWVMAIGRTVFPLWRTRSVRHSLRPIRGCMTAEGRVSFRGQSACAELEPAEGQRLPSGWVTISSDLVGRRDPSFFLLYYREGDGYDGTARIWFPVGPTAEPTVARLPNGVSGLRLDPFDTDLDFTGGIVTIREIGKAQLVGRLIAKQLKGALTNPRVLWAKATKLVSLLARGGMPAVRAKFFADHFTQNYQDWVRRYDTLSEGELESFRQEASGFAYQPKISIVMPTYNTAEQWLRKAIESVLSQTYGHWELCIADDASTDPSVQRVIAEYASRDQRIKTVTLKENQHIAGASNAALDLATGEYIALLDHDDELRPHALSMVVRQLQARPDLDFLYSDEDKITSYGMRFNPHFKSDWNPDLFLSQMYTCHLGVYRRSIVEKVGRFRVGFDGAQDWDLAWRVVDASSPDRIFHIPHILYHWRVVEGSTAQSTSSKPYVMEAQRRSVQDHLDRVGEPYDKVEVIDAISQLRVHFRVPEPAPLVSAIIPTKDQIDLLRQSVEGVLEKTSYKNIQLIIVDNNSSDPATLEYLKELRRDPRVVVVVDQSPFNFSALNNRAVRAAAKGTILAFLNNDLEVIQPGWLTEMVSQCCRPGVGAVGARLLFPNGLLQHGGIILGIGGVAGHNHKGRPRHDPGYFNRIILPQNLSAVTAACLVMPRAVFDEIGGFDAERLSVAFNDVDLCLRVRQKGYRVVYTPYAELYHHESVSRGYETTPEKFARFEAEIGAMKGKWGRTLEMDPYYNPNLTLLAEDFALAFPPRVSRWDSID